MITVTEPILSKPKDRKHPRLISSVLLVNLGTPSRPTYFATMRFLREFLSDSRVIGISKWLWYPILYGFILPFRSISSCNKYQHIYTDKGMPLLYFSQRLHTKIQQRIQSRFPDTQVHLAMRYGDDNIRDQLDQLQTIPHDKLIVVPLFPQYSATTTASVFDAVAQCLRRWNFLPHLHFIRDYCNQPGYIDALAASIEHYWQQHGRGEKLLLSYHGLPEQNLAQGDPYACYCHKTTRLICERLNLPTESAITVFQSRFGPSRWLQPYTEDVLQQLTTEGCQRLDVIAPSFSVDCLETIDEIAREYRDLFIDFGGHSLHYIPALNDSEAAADMLTQVIQQHLSA